MDKRSRILVADPNEDFRQLLCDELENEGDFEVVGATGDGEQAADMALRLRPDVLLTDVILSGIDGLALLERVAQMPEADRPAVVVLSGFAGERVLAAATELGAAYFMQKPCDLSLLLSRIRRFALSGRAGAVRQELAETPRTSLESSVTEIIHEIGIPAHIKGYQYVRAAILLAIEQPGIINAVTKELYPEVARRFGTTSSRVERAIRHAIEVAWDRGDVETLQRFFGYTVSNIKGKPTNSEFIAMISDRISLQRKSVM